MERSDSFIDKATVDHVWVCLYYYLHTTVCVGIGEGGGGVGGGERELNNLFWQQYSVTHTCRILLMQRVYQH